jgi:peptide/nickel transport system substrate-binding protein
MTNYRRLAWSGAVVGVAALALAACGGSSGGNNNSTGSGTQSSFNAAVTSIVNPSDKSGGTLKLGASGDCDSWDPARTYYAWCWDMQRLITRTLMGYQRAPGTDGNKIVPDLALAPGTSDSAKKTWTYHMQSGLKYNTGAPITTKDIKYGIERLYATDVINGGPTFYYLCLLDTCDKSGTPAYKGPYADKTGQPMVNGAPSIDTPNDTTITFHLTDSYGDFDYLMALPASAPVPQSADTGAKYTEHPVSSGPFQVDKYDVGKSISFKKNPNWSQSTDKIRQPHVDAVALTVNANADANDAALKNGQIDLEPDGGVQATLQAEINADPNLKKYADDPVTGFTRYFAVAQTFPPLNNIHCRRAIFYAMNKSDLLKARGGSYGGNVATTMAPPTLPGYDSTADAYPDGPGNTGDLTKAKQELQQCGQPNGFTINEAYVNIGKATKVFEASQQALGRVGIHVVSAPGDQSSYYSTYIGSPSNIINKKLGIMQAGWGADFPTGNGFWNSIVNGAAILPSGNTNYVSLNDPKINDLLKQGLTAQASAAPGIYKNVDAQVMQDAVYLPFLYDKTLYYHNPHLTNLMLNGGIGMYYDYVQLGFDNGGTS